MTAPCQTRPVSVYWNRHRKVWSVRAAGRVRDRVPELTLGACEFVVRAGGQRRAREAGRRSVHAWVRGTPCPAPDGPAVEVRYNPFVHDTFVRADTGRPVVRAAAVRFAPDGRCWAYGPVPPARPEEDAFLAALAGGDRTAMAAYADWLDEHDRPAAAAFWRWGLAHHLRPLVLGPNDPRGKPHRWYGPNAPGERLVPAGGVLPSAVFDAAAAAAGGAPGVRLRLREADPVSRDSLSCDTPLRAWRLLAGAADMFLPEECP